MDIPSSALVRFNSSSVNDFLRCRTPIRHRHRHTHTRRGKKMYVHLFIYIVLKKRDDEEEEEGRRGNPTKRTNGTIGLANQF